MRCYFILFTHDYRIVSRPPMRVIIILFISGLHKVPASDYDFVCLIILFYFNKVYGIQVDISGVHPLFNLIHFLHLTDNYCIPVFHPGSIILSHDLIHFHGSTFSRIHEKRHLIYFTNISDFSNPK